jgi:hypothetical protein
VVLRLAVLHARRISSWRPCITRRSCCACGLETAALHYEADLYARMVSNSTVHHDYLPVASGRRKTRPSPGTAL